MHLLAQLSGDPRLAAPALWACAAAAVAAALLLRRVRRRTGEPPAACPTAAERISVAELPGDAAVSADDGRRRVPRHRGPPTLVDVRGLGDVTQRAKVIDRSRRGLRLAAARAAPVGAVLLVRPCQAPPEAPWLAVTVRWRQRAGAAYTCGCEFAEEPPWAVLILFS